MFQSIKTKTVFFITLIMVITLVAIIYFTHRDVGRAMSEAQRTSTQNVLRSMELRIEGEYKKLLSDKIDMVLAYERQLKNIALVCESFLRESYTLHETGFLTEEEAQRRALRWLKHVEI